MNIAASLTVHTDWHSERDLSILEFPASKHRNDGKWPMSGVTVLVQELNILPDTMAAKYKSSQLAAHRKL